MLHAVPCVEVGGVGVASLSVFFISLDLVRIAAYLQQHFVVSQSGFRGTVGVHIQEFF